MGGKTRTRILRNAGYPTEEFVNDFGEPGAPDQPTPHEPKWLDLSQLTLNPYFEGLFGSRLSYTHGRCEISLDPIVNVSDSRPFPDALLHNFSGEFVSQPSCKTLGLYMWVPGWQADGHARLKYLANAYDYGGIRVGQLLKMIHQQSPTVVTQWIEQVENLRRWVQSGHWKQDIWIVPGQPKLILLLSNQQILGEPDKIHDCCVPYTSSNPSAPVATLQWLESADRSPRLARQGEWMSEKLMKPPRPKFLHAGVVPGIYSIGLEGDLFSEEVSTTRRKHERYARLIELIRREVTFEERLAGVEGLEELPPNQWKRALVEMRVSN